MKKYFVLILLMLFAPLGYAQQFYSLDQYIQAYLENSPDYITDKKNLEIAENDYSVSFMEMFLPSASLNANSVLVRKGDEFFSSLEDRGVSFGASASWNLFNTGRDTLSLRNKKLSLEKQRVSFEEKRQSYVLNAMSAYYDLVLQTALLQVAKDDLEEQTKQYELDKRKYDGGYKTSMDLMQSEINWRNSQLSMAQAEVEYNEALQSFNIAVNRKPLESAQTDENINKVEAPATTLDYDLSYAVNNNYSMVKDRLALRQAEIQKKLSYLSNLPSLSVNASASVERTVRSGRGDDYTNYSIGAGITVPIGFFWIDKYKNIKNAKLQQEISLLDSENLLRNVTNTVITNRNSLELQIKSLEISELRLDIATKKFDITQQKYNQGHSNYIELTDARSDFLTSKNSYLRLLSNLNILYARYKHSLGIKIID